MDGLVLEAVFADRTEDIAARSDNITVPQEQDRVPGVGGYVCGVGSVSKNWSVVFNRPSPYCSRCARPLTNRSPDVVMQ